MITMILKFMERVNKESELVLLNQKRRIKNHTPNNAGHLTYMP